MYSTTCERSKCGSLHCISNDWLNGFADIPFVRNPKIRKIMMNPIAMTTFQTAYHYYFEKTLRLPITFRRPPQHGQGICSLLLTKNSKLGIFNKLIICYNGHTSWMVTPPLMCFCLPSSTLTGASVPFYCDMVIISSYSWSANPVSFWTFYFSVNKNSGNYPY